MATRSKTKVQSSDSESSGCELCSQPNLHMTTCGKLKDARARHFVLSQQLNLDSLICKPCRNDISKCLADPHHSPRWKKSTLKGVCCIFECSDMAEHNCSKFSETDKDVLQKCAIKCKTNVIPDPMPLCTGHYNSLLNATRSTQTHCKTCSADLRHSRNRVCPNPKVILEYLTENTGYEGELGPDDRVCEVCYRSHLNFIKKQSKSIISRDEDLQQLIHSYQQQQKEVSEIFTTDDLIGDTMVRVTVMVAERLLRYHVLLLPTVQTYFHTRIRFVHQTSKTCTCTSSSDVLGQVSSRWILSNLLVNLNVHIATTCKVRKHGTLIYRPKTDFTRALSYTLWTLKESEHNDCDDKPPVEHLDPLHCGFNKESYLNSLNDAIHVHIKNSQQINNAEEFDYSDLNVKKHISNVPKDLWYAICQLTRSKRERDGKSRASETGLDHQIKNLRRFFIVCAICFCTNERCSSEMHTLLTDIIDSQGGTELLIRILNRPVA